MWHYPDIDREQAARSVEKVAHLKAHHLYLDEHFVSAAQLYRETLEHLLPKLHAQDGQRPARVLLRSANKMAFYAWRIQDTSILQKLWERYGLAFHPQKLDHEALEALCVLAVLTGQENTEPVTVALKQLRETTSERWACIGVLDGNQRISAISALCTHFENVDGEGTARRPWDDDPLIACYERLHQLAGTSWKSRAFHK